MQPTNDAHFAEVGPGTYLVSTEDESVDLTLLSWQLSTEGWRPLLIDRHTAADKSSLLDAIAVGLGFPDWFGHNWDALVELLRQWASYQPLALVIADLADRIGADAPDAPQSDELATVATLVDIIDDLVVEGCQIKLGVAPLH